MIVARRAAVVAVGLILAGCGSTTPPGPATASPAASPRTGATSSPATPSGPSASGAQSGSAWAVDDAVRSSADPGLVSSLDALPAPPDGVRYAVTGIRQQGDWAVVAFSDARPQAASDSGIALAVRSGGAWTVVLADDPTAFCAALAKTPPGAITQDERDYFMGCN